jgi:hypothetical protein
MTNSWFFPPVANYDEQGRRVSEQNFVVEARSELAILIRELLQNALDARRQDFQSAVSVSIRLANHADIDLEYLKGIISDDLLDRLIASSDESQDIDINQATALVIEDFGTTGLEGIYNDSTVDGRGENWNSFWFREGEGAKGNNSSNGGAGQGKITFYSQGSARTVAAFSIRASDAARLLMGRVAFRRDYRKSAGEPKSKKVAYWCELGKESTPTPCTSQPELDKFRAAFGLLRTSEPGLSLVIPFPRTYSRTDALKIVLGEFFFPIARGRLKVTIDGEEVNEQTVAALAEKHLEDKQVRKEFDLCMTAGYRRFLLDILKAEKEGSPPALASRDWAIGPAVLKPEHFSAGEVDSLREKLHAGTRIHVRFPIKVQGKIDKTAVWSFLDVHLELPTELAETEEAFIRNDLLIGKERRLKSQRHLPKVRALTFISDEQLSKLMADAEEASHLEWNGKRETLTERWKNGPEIVRQVRNALLRLLTLLASVEGTRDTRALARFFAKPAEKGSASRRGKEKGEKDQKEDKNLPPPPPALFRINAGDASVTVTSTGQPKVLNGTGLLKIAFDELDGSPFKSYDPFDFDLAQTEIHAIAAVGCTVLSRDLNEIRFRVDAADMSLRVDGFEAKNVPLVARLSFQEFADVAHDETE